jgi:formiminoglutamate deiminase
MKRLWFKQAYLATGWANDVSVSIKDGIITEITSDSERPVNAQSHALALPGISNVHSHGFQRGMAGLSERRGHPDDDFWSWRKIMYRFLDRLTPDDIAAITALAYAEMLETGFTHVGEFHYLLNDPEGLRYTNPAETVASIIEASDMTGIGLTLLPVFYAHSNFGGANPLPGQRRFLSNIDSFATLMSVSRKMLSADSILGVAPHSLRAITPHELATVLSYNDDGPVHIHAAEQSKEVDACIKWSDARPIEWLLDNAPVDHRWCLIHATHLNKTETTSLAASGAVAGLCPITEANLGDGIFPAIDYLGAGGRIAVGTDSNIMIDAAGELRGLEYSQRLRHQRRALIATEQCPSVGAHLFNAALSGGAQALGISHGLAVGASADIVTLNMSHPSLIGADPETLIDRWVFASRTDMVDMVWRRGKLCVEAGRHIAWGAITNRYSKTLEKLLS